MSRISHIFAFLSLKLLKRFIQTCSQLRRRNTRDHREKEFQGGGVRKGGESLA